MSKLEKALENIELAVEEIGKVVESGNLIEDPSVFNVLESLLHKAKLFTLLKMEHSGMAKKDMAKSFDVSPARISQLLKEGKELLLETPPVPKTALDGEYGYTHVSDRGLPLMYRKAPLDGPILTVEHYAKWYDLFVVMPDGSIETVLKGDKFNSAFSRAKEVWEPKRGSYFVDHTWNPDFIQVLAFYMGAYIDQEAHELIVGRWAIETNELYASAGCMFEDEQEVMKFIINK